MKDSRTPLISAIVPISGMVGRLQNLKSWVGALNDEKVEVILIHDIKDNETGDEIVDLIMGLSRKPIFLECTSGNPGETRNLGLQVATGDWIVFWDCDDLPNVTATVKYLENSTRISDLIIGEFTWVSELSGEQRGSENLANHKINALIAVALNPGIWRMIFKRSLIGNTLFSPSRMAEDQVFIASILSKNPKIDFRI